MRIEAAVGLLDDHRTHVVDGRADRVAWWIVGTILLFVGTTGSAAGAGPGVGDFTISPESVPCCDSRLVEAIVWSGSDSLMRIEDLAAYCAPVLWFSPDEPLLVGASGEQIRLPQAFPFEGDSLRPVAYYRVREILTREDRGQDHPAYLPDSTVRGHSEVDLSRISGFHIDFFFYYATEEGMGHHRHDVECAEFVVGVWRRDGCSECPFNLVVTRVTGKAHGILWYDNMLSIDQYTRFPMRLLVEEGKHATCTDKNGDGYFTPGFDANRRPNDAWGVRDVMRGGTLFTSGYQSWMTKVRRPDHQVLPPLPADSPLRDRLSVDGVYAAGHAVYELRPFPSAEKAEPELVPFIASKGPVDWPEVRPLTGMLNFGRWSEGGAFAKSLSAAARFDGELGVSLIFPLFIVKNFEDPLAGGFIVNRVYFKDHGLRDFAWTLLYTQSASRWVGPYISAGLEFNDPESPPDPAEPDDRFVFETGVKFRMNMMHSPLRFMTLLTDFWGYRVGVKATGFADITQFKYVIEIGGGTW
jgi:hypothetical protein